MVLRPATRDDAAVLMEIRRAVRENAISEARLATLGITEESIADMLESSHAGFCAEVDGQVMGFSMADLEKGWIFALFVHPKFEGRGAGRALLAAAVGSLREAGHRRACLSTDPGTRAFRIYAEAGWRYTGTSDLGEALFELELLPARGRPAR